MSLQSTQKDLGQCRAYLVSQMEAQERAAAVSPEPGPAITLSFQTGAGAHQVARHLAAVLQRDEPGGSPAWTVFDRQLVEKVLEDHHLPRALAKHMPEEHRSYIQDVMDELVGLRPPSWVIVPKIAETVLHLVEAGHVVLVGRGAAFITARMPNVFHVRLVSSLPRRIERMQQLENLPKKEAAKLIARSDRGSGGYVRAHFHARVGDDLQYHLVLNTDRIPLNEAAELIADGARRRFHRLARGGP